MDKLAKVFEAVSKLMELDSCSTFLKSVFPTISLSLEPNPLSQEGKGAFKEAVIDLISILMQDQGEHFSLALEPTREEKYRVLFDKMGFT